MHHLAIVWQTLARAASLWTALSKWIRRVPFIKKNLRIHYTYTTREDCFFESVTTLDVFKSGVTEYRTGLGATRNLTSDIISPDPRMKVVVAPEPSGSRRHFVVHIQSGLNKGIDRIPLQASMKDPNVTHPKITFEVPTKIGELVLVVRLPVNEKVRMANSWIFKPGRNECKTSEVLWIWKNNVFAATFRPVKPGYKYEVTWEYEEGSPVSTSCTVENVNFK